MLTTNQIILLLKINKSGSSDLYFDMENTCDLIVLFDRNLITGRLLCTTKGKLMCENVIDRTKW